MISFVFLPFLSVGQKVIYFDGLFEDGRAQNGRATYTYYEDQISREYIKNGSFKYVFKGQEGYKGFDEIITGNFNKGLKNGQWTYTINMTDFGTNNPYTTGTVILHANYKNGYADGNWNYTVSFKKRSLYLQRGVNVWGQWGPIEKTVMSINFDSGYLVGSVNVNDDFLKTKISGKYDKSSCADGIWLFITPAVTKELIYKDQVYYQYLERDSKGQIVQHYDGRDDNGNSKYLGIIKFDKDYDLMKQALLLSKSERDNEGYIFTSKESWATEYLKVYLKQLLENNYFLYKYIGGDLSYEKGFMGGGQLHVEQKKYYPISSLPLYEEAEKAYAAKNYIDALNKYSQLEKDRIKPSDNKLLEQKIKDTKILADNQIATYINEKEFYESYINAKYLVFQKGFDSTISKFVLQLNIFSKYIIDRNASGAQASVKEKPEFGLRGIKSLDWGSTFYARPLLSSQSFHEYSSDGKNISGFVMSSDIAESYDDRISKVIAEMLQQEKNSYEKNYRTDKKYDYFEMKNYRREVLNSLNTLEGKKSFLAKIMSYDKSNKNKVENDLEECRRYGVLTDLQIKFIESSIVYKNFLTEKLLLLQKNEIEINYPTKGRLRVYKIERTEFLNLYNEATAQFEAAMELMKI